MHRRTVGALLIVIAAFLYAVRYLTAAIYGSNMSSWNKDHFDSLLSYVGSGPLIVSWIALIAGLVMFLPDISKLVKKQLDTIDENWKEADIMIKEIEIEKKKAKEKG